MKKPTHLMIGGLVALGFDASGRFLLTVSHSGRGVFAVESWQRVARDPALAYPEDGVAIGIGPIAGERIPVSSRDEKKESIELKSPDGRFTLLGESDGITVTSKGEPNQPPQHNAGSRPTSDDSPASETPSSLGPRG